MSDPALLFFGFFCIYYLANQFEFATTNYPHSQQLEIDQKDITLGQYWANQDWFSIVKPLRDLPYRWSKL